MKAQRKKLITFISRNNRHCQQEKQEQHSHWNFSYKLNLLYLEKTIKLRKEIYYKTNPNTLEENKKESRKEKAERKKSAPFGVSLYCGKRF
jgi:hypothetical protein